MRDWLIHIKRGEYASLQTQIREALVSAILDRQLDQQEPIPSTRKMAKSLGVSRNTVVLAYQGLLDDGYLLAKQRSGYFVSDKALEDHMPKARKAASPEKPKGTGLNWERLVNKHPSHQPNTVKVRNWQDFAYPFIYGQVDHTLFPLAEWRDCTRQALGKKWLGDWTNDFTNEDDPLLVEQIRRRILPRRGIMAHDDEILVTLGAQNAIYLITSLLVNQDTRVVMEEPGYPDMRNIFQLRSQNVGLAPVDQSGLMLGPELDNAQIVYTTPSHQFPTTVTMPLERRMALLKKASEKNFIVVEDDYEFETNYVNEPCPALKSLDDDGRVIYVGSLSKTLFPGLRLGFMVAPKALIAEARALRRLMVRHAPSNNQRTAALFLSLGHHDALIRKLHKAYRTRWEIMGAALSKHLPSSARNPSFGGTSYWVKGPAKLDADALSQAATAKGVLINPGRICFGAAQAPRNYFRLAFSSIDEKKIEPGIKLLSELIKQPS
ncbi:PLP-dependent aminotransferase family protein [Aestuariivirga litoralis]|uniref:MocR-like pyridoxine biosynthesis transcription factor PdxR n=1 Tax=Aestuariivirga litoralis TaxID=2650924 RepID=UPI0018C6A8AB|nr:PLP-dependent aminotransferase family protein [Aestuariivirga litoralis]MBG1231996.1 PLP-dependent aminotransferase family protein [Aestuariivirga litoralis]